MTRERDVPCTQPSRQSDAGGETDAKTPIPPLASDRNVLSALLKFGEKNLDLT